MNPPFHNNNNLHEACLLDFLGHAIPKRSNPEMTVMPVEHQQGMQWDAMNYRLPGMPVPIKPPTANDTKSPI